jgi:hypothetical protein
MAHVTPEAVTYGRQGGSVMLNAVKHDNGLGDWVDNESGCLQASHPPEGNSQFDKKPTQLYYTFCSGNYSQRTRPVVS